MSSLSIDPRYQRKVPADIPPAWRVQEAACTLFVWGTGAMLWASWLPLQALWVWYLVLVTILILNGVRTLAAHRYGNEDGVMTREEQLLDSVNIAGRSPWTPVLAPVGLRYHALHHLFPTMPYHHLGEAHRRLMKRLPPDAPYRATVEPGFAAALADLWRRAGRHGVSADMGGGSLSTRT
jgi:fatty acid desaturase